MNLKNLFLALEATLFGQTERAGHFVRRSRTICAVLVKSIMRNNLVNSFCLFDLILYVPSTIFQLCRDVSSWVEPVFLF